MSKQRWLNWVIGPGLTVLATVIYDYLVREQGWPVTTAILFPFVVLAGFANGSPLRPWDGLWAGLICAAWVSGFSVYLAPELVFERAVLVPLAVVLIALAVGFLRAWAWRGLAMQQAAGEMALEHNLARLKGLEDLSRELYYEWDRLNEAERKGRVSQLWDRANNIASLADGWRQVGWHQYWARLK